MTKVKRPYYSDFMTKHKPKVPKSICTSLFNGNMGIISPSLHLNVLLGGKGETAAEELKNYELLFKKYLCYKRKLSKSQWKNLYRIYREKSKTNTM